MHTLTHTPTHARTHTLTLMRRTRTSREHGPVSLDRPAIVVGASGPPELQDPEALKEWLRTQEWGKQGQRVCAQRRNSPDKNVFMRKMVEYVNWLLPSLHGCMRKKPWVAAW